MAPRSHRCGTRAPHAPWFIPTALCSFAAQRESSLKPSAISSYQHPPCGFGDSGRSVPKEPPAWASKCHLRMRHTLLEWAQVQPTSQRFNASSVPFAFLVHCARRVVTEEDIERELLHGEGEATARNRSQAAERWADAAAAYLKRHSGFECIHIADGGVAEAQRMCGISRSPLHGVITRRFSEAFTCPQGLEFCACRHIFTTHRVTSKPSSTSWHLSGSRLRQ